MTAESVSSGAAPVSLYQLLDPEILANPYPLYERLRTESPVHWDPYLHAWVVTRYDDVSTVLRRYRAARMPEPERLVALGMEQLSPIASLMVRQMLFLDPPDHGRVRRLAAHAFTARRVALLREHVAGVAAEVIDELVGEPCFDLMAAVANPLPAIVLTAMLGVPRADHGLLKDWSSDFAEMLGNFQHNPGRITQMLASVEAMVAYFQAAIRREATHPTEGLINALATAEVDGDSLSEEEAVANVIIAMVGGQEATTNMIGNGLLTLLRQPAQLQRLREAPDLMPAAVEELLRYESPTQYSARLAPAGAELGGQEIPEGAAVIAVIGAGNRDPARFDDPNQLDFGRPDNRHLAFGWASHFCFGAPLARLEGEIAFSTLLDRFPRLSLNTPDDIRWKPNLGLRGLTALSIRTA
jgi:cytochrome P450